MYALSSVLDLSTYFESLGFLKRLQNLFFNRLAEQPIRDSGSTTALRTDFSRAALTTQHHGPPLRSVLLCARASIASESVRVIMATSVPSESVTGPSSTPTQSRTSNPTLFSPGASPPLILAFLAIGLFTISMVAVFGWRRVRLGRGAALHPFRNDETEFGEWRRGFGEKPKLWDLWTDGRAVGNEGDVGWDAIMVCRTVAHCRRSKELLI